MAITINYDAERDCTSKEELVIFAIEKLLNGFRVEQVNQILGKVAERVNQSVYETPHNHYDAEEWNNYVVNAIKNNLDTVTDGVAKKLAKTLNVMASQKV